MQQLLYKRQYKGRCWETAKQATVRHLVLGNSYA
jgi:hypothetical protein